jgi:hypothetical protein
MPTAVAIESSPTPVCEPELMPIALSEVDAEVGRTIDRFLESREAESLVHVGVRARESPQYSPGWILWREGKAGLVDLGLNVVILGSFWVEASEYFDAIGGGSGDVLQIAVFYSPEFDIVLPAVLSAEIRDHWAVVSNVVVDDFFDQAEEENAEPHVLFSSKCDAEQWVDDHTGGLASIGVYLYHDYFGGDLLTDTLDPPLPDLLLNPNGYVARLTRHPPNINQVTIPIVLGSILQEDPALILKGVVPYSE